MADETARQQDEGQKRERVFVNLPSALYRPANAEYTAVRRDGDNNVVSSERRPTGAYNRYMIPSGVKVGDRYLTGCTAIIDDPFVKKLRGDMLGFSYLKGQRVNLSRPAYEDGHYVHDDEGRQVYERFSVDAAELADECAKLTYLVVPESFVTRNLEMQRKDGSTYRFSAVRLTQGVNVDGVDCGNASIYPMYVMRGYRSENAAVIPLLRDRGVSVQPAKTPEGEWNHGHGLDFLVDPVKLVNGVNKAHREYRQRAKADGGPSEAPAEEVGAPALDDDIEMLFATEEPSQGPHL